MKVTIIETTTVTLLDPVHATHYFVEGRQVNEKTFKRMTAMLDKTYMLDKTVIRERTNDWGNKKKTTDFYYIEK